MIELDTVLIKVASRCNINCSYCYVYNMGDAGWADMPNQISRETTRAVARALKELSRLQDRPFAVVLHGGEPLLLGPEKLRYVLSMLRGVLPGECAISLQTNGILIGDEILDVCSETHTTISVSLDGPRHVHDRFRVGHTGWGTYDKVLAGLKRLRRHPDAKFLFTGLLAVVDPESDPAEVYGFFKSLEPPSVDFIYRDGNHSRLPYGKKTLHSTEYGSWMGRLLDIYLADQTPIRIRILDDVIKLMLGGSGTKDGVGLTNYGVLIIDTDGTITKNDTLKSSFDGADRFSQKWSVHTHGLADVLNSGEFAEYQAMQRPSSKVCLACPELRVCGGGMTLHRWRDDNGYDNPSVFCDDQKLLLSHILRYLPVAQP
ncbi:MAG: cyclophane-forming radical SAM/SPASM peptide maturase YhhB [Pyrinomonadaceae bacterium]